MAKEFAKGFYASPMWHKVRQSYICQRRAIDGGMCEECHEEPGYIVHHKIELTAKNISNLDIACGFSNLEYVCKACHDQIHEHCGREKPKRLVKFHKNGDPVMPGGPL